MGDDASDSDVFARAVEGLIAETDEVRAQLEQWEKEEDEDWAILAGEMPDYAAIERRGRMQDEICYTAERLLPRIEATLISRASDLPFLDAVLKGFRRLRIYRITRAVIYRYPLQVPIEEDVAVQDLQTIKVLLQSVLNLLPPPRKEATADRQAARPESPIEPGDSAAGGTPSTGPLSKRDQAIFLTIGEKKIGSLSNSEIVKTDLRRVGRELHEPYLGEEALRNSLKRIRAAKGLPSSKSLRRRN